MKGTTDSATKTLPSPGAVIATLGGVASGAPGKGSPQVADHPPTSPPAQPWSHEAPPISDARGNSPQRAPGAQVPSASWQGVRSRPDASSSHAMFLCITV